MTRVEIEINDEELAETLNEMGEDAFDMIEIEDEKITIPVSGPCKLFMVYIPM